MGIRQVLGFFFSGGLIWGFFVWLFSKNRRSAGDLLAGTVVLREAFPIKEIDEPA
jgi:uncharacterized RDD family membrane protein YckC